MVKVNVKVLKTKIDVPYGKSLFFSLFTLTENLFGFSAKKFYIVCSKD
jgi:hypothetical protein